MSDYMAVNYDLIDSLDPDIVFTDTGLQRDITNELWNNGYRVLHYEPNTLEEVLDSIIITEDGLSPPS